jgi:hypothetical protein
MTGVRRRPLRTTRGALGPDRGRCAVCGRALTLRLADGYMKHHRDRDGEPCPGGGRPPASSAGEETVATDDRL